MRRKLNCAGRQAQIRINSGPENLIYKWSNGVTVFQNQNGYGKNMVILEGSILGREESIDLLVTDPVNNLVAQSSVNIVPIDPQIVFYENNPYYGYIFDSATENPFKLKTEEIQILAAPYYFTKEQSGLLVFDWQLNGASVPNLSSSRTAIFKKPEGKSGESNISLRVENSSRILQQADGSLIINFSK
jgi:hypothetical protein